MSRCSVCNGTGQISPELKTRVKFKGTEIYELEDMLIEILESDPEPHKRKIYERFLDRLHRPGKKIGVALSSTA